MLDRRAYQYAIVGLAAGLGLFLIGVSVIVSLDEEVPKELWAVGTAIGGGLLGVVIPSPKATPPAKTLVASAVVQSAAVTAAARRAAAEPEDLRPQAEAAVNEVRQAPTPAGAADEPSTAIARTLNEKGQDLTNEAAATADAGEKAGLQAMARVHEAAAQAALAPETQASAQSAAQQAPAGQADNKDYITKLGPPLLIFVVGLALGSLLVMGVIAPAEPYQGKAIEEGNALLALAISAAGAFIGVLAPSPGQKGAS